MLLYTIQHTALGVYMFSVMRSRCPLKGRRQHTEKHVTRRISISKPGKSAAPRRTAFRTGVVLYIHARGRVYIRAPTGILSAAGAAFRHAVTTTMRDCAAIVVTLRNA